MRVFDFAFLLYLITLVASAPPTAPATAFDLDLARLDVDAVEIPRHAPLEKRKGGGGKGGGGGGKGSSSGSSGSSGGSGRPASSYSFSPQSNMGGRTISGSGTPKTYGNRYTGGATVPYTAGARSPTRGIAPYALGAGALAFFPGLWLYSTVWAYPYYYPYHWYYNGQNHTSNVTCLCQRYQVCGCDPTDNSTYLDQVILNGTGQPVNSSLVRTVDFGNGTVGTYINGSLANGTTSDGGTDPSNESEISAALRLGAAYGGYGVMVVTVVLGILMTA